MDAVMPWLQDADVTLYHGDVLSTLRELPAESVDCVVTSPPYWGLRDYGTEGQLGLEPTPEQYVERMVEVFREVRRVLTAHGTVWLNLGDSYYTDTYSNRNNATGGLGGSGVRGGGALTHKRDVPGLKPKDLVGIPWRVAFALQADGWYLRSAITWCKPNCMPESVTDRPTKATEMVFLLSKNPRYYYDIESTRESSANATGRTNGTAPSSATLRPELRATLNTDDGTTDTWGWCDLGELQVAITPSMTGETQRFEVLQPVGINIGVETAEGPLVVNLESGGLAAANATMPVALSSKLALLSPVWASVVDASSAPSGAALANHVGSDPTTAALSRAEVTSLELTHIAGEWLAAEIALESEELSATLLVWGTSGPTHQRNTTEATGRNARDWWLIPTQPYPEAHFATFPEELARRCIAAGCPEQVCRVCGAPRTRITSTEYVKSPVHGAGSVVGRHYETGANNFDGAGMPRLNKEVTTVGFTECDCAKIYSQGLYECQTCGVFKTKESPGDGCGACGGILVLADSPRDVYRPGIVLDPFMGSGTVAYVARKLGRHAVGIDLNAEYLELAARRLQQQSLFAGIQ